MGTQQAILLIEDDTNFARILETQLRRSGFDVNAVRDVAAGLQCLLRRPFDLVLVDVRLPDANGLEVVPRLRAIVPATPFLLITAYEEENLRARAIAAGAADVLYKPFDMDFLVEAVRARISESRREPEPATALPWLAVTPGQVVILQSLGVREPREQTARVERTNCDAFQVEADRAIVVDARKPVMVSIYGGDALYQFQTHVLEAGVAGTALVLTQPKVIHRRQRRRHPRIALNLPVSLQSMTPSEEKVEGMIRDVSLGGMALVAPSYLPPGTPALLHWALPTPFRGEVKARGTVLRVEVISDLQQLGIYRLALRFTRFLSGSRSLLQDCIASCGKRIK
jgi:DNA-binding response OmpR family regulator